MNGFRGNHRSTEPGKKGRSAKAHHHNEACKCSAPLLKLHYNDCPVLSKPCPLHGNGLQRTLKQENSEREQNVAVSSNPSSKTERLFRPVKSLLTVCDPETRFNFRHCAPKTSSSHETVKRVTDSEHLRMNFNKIFVEKAKPFVTGQTNKIKKLKQCFHSPCNTILQKSRSHTLVKEKSKPERRDFYMMPDMPPDEKKNDSGFKWFPSGKLGFKGSEKKNDWVPVTRGGSNQVLNTNKTLGPPNKPQKGVKEIPVFGFPKEATQFVYSSFTYQDSRRRPQDDRMSYSYRRNSKDKGGLVIHETSHTEECQSSSSDDSIYFAPFLLRPTLDTDSDLQRRRHITEEAFQKPKLTACISTQTFPTEDRRKRLTVSLQTERDIRDCMTQTELICDTRYKKMDDNAGEDLDRRLSYVIQPVAQGSEESLGEHKAEAQEKGSPLRLDKKCLPGQTSWHEELCNAVSDLTELKNIIYEYFRRCQPTSDGRAKVDHETMTDSFLLKTFKTVCANAEAQTSQDPRPRVKPGPSAGQDFQCHDMEDRDRAAMMCVCSLCGKEVKTFTVNIMTSSESNGTLLEVVEKSNEVDIYREMVEMKAMRTKVKTPETEASNRITDNRAPESRVPPPDHMRADVRPTDRMMEPPKPTKKYSEDYARHSAQYESRPLSPCQSVTMKKSEATPRSRQKSEGGGSIQSPYMKPKTQGRSSSPPAPPKDKDYTTEHRMSEGRERGRSRARASEFYYPVIIKPYLSKQVTKMLEKKIHENASDDSDTQSVKQKRTYDKYFEQSDIPAGKKIKGLEDQSREFLTHEKPTLSDLVGKKKDTGPLKKGYGLLLPFTNDHFCGKQTPKPPKERKPKNLSHVKSLSLSSLNNLFTAEGRHLKPIPIGCDEQSLRELLEFSTCKSVRLLKTSADGLFYHPWPNGILAYEADEGSLTSTDEKKFSSTPSCENSPEEEICECTCCRSDSNETHDTPDTQDSQDTPPMEEIIEEPEERDWERQPDLKTHRKVPQSFPTYTLTKKCQSGETFWFGTDQKKN